MVTIKAILKENEPATPEKECELKFGNHFDGENFYYFESEDEKVKFYESLESKE